MNSLKELENLGLTFTIQEKDNYGFQDVEVTVPKNILDKVVEKYDDWKIYNNRLWNGEDSNLNYFLNENVYKFEIPVEKIDYCNDSFYEMYLNTLNK